MTFLDSLVNSLTLVLFGGMLAFNLMRGDVAFSVMWAVIAILALLGNIIHLMDSQ